MPELPEVETTKCGIKPFIEQQVIKTVVVRQTTLRWPIPDLVSLLRGQQIENVARRAKYLLIKTTKGHLIIHLGMSGHLRVLAKSTPANKHDHVDIILSNQKILRYTDPRRFGAILWTTNPLEQHPLLGRLGPEPLSKAFNADYLYQQSHKRHTTIKQLIMDSKIVVGVGNIYASEALFHSGIRPTAKAGKISKARIEKLTQAIKQVLKAAIKQGGTSLKDFYAADGAKGYFAQKLYVYGRADQACLHCGSKVKSIRLAQRNTFYCQRCQR